MSATPKRKWAELQDGSDLPFDLNVAMSTVRASPEMMSVVDLFGIPQLYTKSLDEIRGGKDYYESIVHAIVSQQIADAAARTMYSNVEKLCAPKGITPSRILDIVGFCGKDGDSLKKRDEVKAVCKKFEPTRKAAGLSEAKLVAMVGVAAKWGELEEELERDPIDEVTLREKLLAVNGVGAWTVDMLMLFKFRLADVWPVGDLAFRGGLATTFNLKKELNNKNANDLESMNEIGMRFKGFRSVVAVLMYRVYDASKAASKTNSPKKKKKKTT
ncbi:hypothetical protein TrST_g5586 [Triparma strigata]|uniref:HhH-GPD domain-containing protein n=1 Tax=Triparma strigata TaxID=1606541 RepID=A0A9W7AZ42_9STRA|nr:hypothetical protein TrST_g5586 [Triparma strigata]